MQAERPVSSQLHLLHRRNLWTKWKAGFANSPTAVQLLFNLRPTAMARLTVLRDFKIKSSLSQNPLKYIYYRPPVPLTITYPNHALPALYHRLQFYSWRVPEQRAVYNVHQTLITFCGVVAKMLITRARLGAHCSRRNDTNILKRWSHKVRHLQQLWGYCIIRLRVSLYLPSERLLSDSSIRAP